MVCIRGQIRTRLMDDICNNSHEGLISQDEWHDRLVECDVFKKDLATGSLTNHLETQHDVFGYFVLNRDLIVDREPQVFNETYSHARKPFLCPVLGCTGGLSTKWNLRQHFLDWHPDNLVNILCKRVYCQFGWCHMQVSPLASGHEQTKHFRE